MAVDPKQLMNETLTHEKKFVDGLELKIDQYLIDKYDGNPITYYMESKDFEKVKVERVLKEIRRRYSKWAVKLSYGSQRDDEPGLIFSDLEKTDPRFGIIS